MLKYYPALIHKDPGSIYGVSFPDLPGCVGAADTAEAAIADAAAALQFHIDGMLADKEAIPTPSPLEAVRDPDAVAITLIPARLPTKAARINITVDTGLLADIDARANAEGLNRSAFFAQAAREKLRA